MRYRFIQAEKASYPVEALCRVLTVARSGYYAWCRRPLGARAQQNQGLLTQIRTCYQASRGRYGSPRIHQDLRAHGFRVGRHRVARLMRLHGLRSIRRRRTWRHTQPAHSRRWCGRTSCDEHLPPRRPNEKWAADITYVPTRQGWLYLAVVHGFVLAAGGRLGHGCTADDRTDGDGLRDGAAPTACAGWAPAPFGSRQPVWRHGVSATVGDSRHPVLDEPSRQLLG